MDKKQALQHSIQTVFSTKVNEKTIKPTIYTNYRYFYLKKTKESLLSTPEFEAHNVLKNNMGVSVFQATILYNIVHKNNNMSYNIMHEHKNKK